MPLIKSERMRSDLIESTELQDILAKMPRGQESIPGTYVYTNKKTGQIVEEKFNIPVPQMRVILILLWLYGRRIQEVLLVRRKDVWWDSNYLNVRFYAMKRKDTMKKQRRKPIPFKNPYVAEVVDYVSSINSEDAYLFPGDTKGEWVRKVVARDEEGKIKIAKKGKNAGKEMIYYYKPKAKGIMSTERAWKSLKFLAPDLWLHFFRINRLTFIADKTGDPFKLRDWVDWSTIAPADSYVGESEARMQEVGDLMGAA